MYESEKAVSRCAKVSYSAELVKEACEERELLRDPLSKRIFDVALSLFGLFIMAPLWVLIVVLIWLEDGYPILLLQERIGKGSKFFSLQKFRTMREDAEGVGVIVDRPEDSRVTGVGRILRATAMDELPQLVNILKGEMSFVGPRALPLHIEDHERSRYSTIEEIEGYGLRSRVRPGLTGITQIFVPKDIPRRSKFRYDLFYIRKWSFWLDLRLIFVSVWITLRGKWEARGSKI